MPSPPTLIAPPVAPMYREPDFGTEQVSQALIGIEVQVVDRQEGWCRIETPDTYEGWVEASALVAAPRGWSAPWAEVTDLWINLRLRPDYKLAPAHYGVIGARLPLVGRDEGWAQLLMPDGRALWTEAKRVAELGGAPLRPAEPHAITRTARRFLRVPYLWGGCCPLGIDCSGFVQLILRLHGIPLLRDAHQQQEQGAPVDEPDAADLVFFGPEGPGGPITHVGMMLDRRRFIHASGSSYVRINSLSEEPYRRQVHSIRRYLVPEAPADQASIASQAAEETAGAGRAASAAS